MPKPFTATIGCCAESRRYLHGLVTSRAADEDALKVRIEALINEFRDAVGVDDNAGSESSIADVFGLVFAAGTLAQEYGALPAKLKLLPVVVKVYELNRRISSPPPTNVQRLRRLAEHKDAILVDARNLQDLTDEASAAAPALVRTDRSGASELLLTDAGLLRAFPMRGRILKDPEIRAIMRNDKDGRKKVSVSVRVQPKQERFYAFVLNPKRASK